eukprot:gene19152-21071_t
MHGVLKVKTTAEQEAERKKEREEKAKKYLALSRRIFSKRKNEETDDELMELTEKILIANPDSYTMWNIRKESLLHFNEKRTEDEMQHLYLHDLKLLQDCLGVNPKSYGVWNHRRFCLENMPKADWANELKLCNKFLSFDARNFHCWDYRRYVVDKANISPEEELAFTKKKISENFSNYSAWHNRSKLLPLIHPVAGQKDKIEEKALLKEFEMVQNAFFTDPNDQSAWFYQRWLLGREEKGLEILHFGVRRLSSCIWIVLSLSKPSKLSAENKAKLCINDEEIENLSWKSSQDEASWHWSQEENITLFRDEHTAAKSSVLENELESCNMLLEEETDNKWAILTVVFLMRAIDPEKYIQETEKLFEKLLDCDPLRREYYLDLRSKYRIENELQRLKESKGNFEMLDLSNKDLTTVYHWQYLTGFKHVNLSGNCLRKLKGIHALQNVRNIAADNCGLKSSNFTRVYVQPVFQSSRRREQTHLDVSKRFYEFKISVAYVLCSFFFGRMQLLSLLQRDIWEGFSHLNWKEKTRLKSSSK